MISYIRIIFEFHILVWPSCRFPGRTKQFSAAELHLIICCFWLANAQEKYTQKQFRVWLCRHNVLSRSFVLTHGIDSHKTTTNEKYPLIRLYFNLLAFFCSLLSLINAIRQCVSFGSSLDCVAELKRGK